MKLQKLAIAAVAVSLSGVAFANDKSSQTSASSTQDPGYSSATAANTGSNAGTTANDADLIRQVQQALNDKGLNAGPVDGQLGPKTKSALRQFQQKQGIQRTASLDSQTLSALGVQGGSQNANTTSSTSSSLNNNNNTSSSMSGTASPSSPTGASSPNSPTSTDTGPSSSESTTPSSSPKQ